MSVRRSVGWLIAMGLLVAIAVGLPVERVAFALVLPCIVVFALGTLLGSDEVQRGAVRVGVPALVLGMVLPGARALLRALLGDGRVQLAAMVLGLVLLLSAGLVLVGRGLLATPRGPWRPLRAPRALVVDPDFSSVRPPVEPTVRTGDDLRLFSDNAPPVPAEREPAAPEEFVVFRSGRP